MEKEGLINRVVISTKPTLTEYSITEKGKMLKPVLELLAEFSMKHEPTIIFKDKKQRNLEGVFGIGKRLSSVYNY